MLFIKGLVGLVNGWSGVIFDVGVYILNLYDIVVEKYDSDVSLVFKKILEVYVVGVNSYVVFYKKEILYRKFFFVIL